MIKPRSTRMQKLMRAYNKEAREWLIGKFSPVSGKIATQVHHMRGKLGTLRFDKRFWLAVTFEDHRWIEDNKEKARHLGLECQRGEWHVAPEDSLTEEIRQRMIEICKK